MKINPISRSYKSADKPKRQMGTFKSYVMDRQEEEAREKYRVFCEESAKDLDPIEAEYGGIPTFEEWLIDCRKDDYA